jgi:hypothetical protein
MGNGASPHGPSYRAHPRLYRAAQSLCDGCPQLAKADAASLPVSGDLLRPVQRLSVAPTGNFSAEIDFGLSDTAFLGIGFDRQSTVSVCGGDGILIGVQSDAELAGGDTGRSERDVVGESAASASRVCVLLVRSIVVRVG